MRILVTNDDGIDAPGLKALVARIATLGEIFVVVPEREQSTVGHALTLHKPLRVTPVNFPGCRRAWKTSGTPSDCVKLGTQALLKGKKINLVISGINRGANLGTDILYSGTVAAAFEGAVQGLPAMAISLAGRQGDFIFAAEFARRVISRKFRLPKGVVLNINVPPGKPRRAVVTRLGIRRYEDAIRRRRDPLGRAYYWLAAEALKNSRPLKDTDVGAIEEGKISLTPIHFDLTDYPVLARLKRTVGKFA